MINSSGASPDRVTWPTASLLRVHVSVLATIAPLTIRFRSLSANLSAYTPPCAWKIYSRLSADDIVSAVRHRLRRPWFMRHRRCLREGLLAFYFLRLAGVPAVLRIGVYPTDNPRTRAHCWITLGNRCLTAEPLPPYVTMVEHT